MREISDVNPDDFTNVADAKGVYAKFFYRPELDQAATDEAGIPKYKDVAYIEIIAAGNSTNIVRRPVRDTDKQRFHNAYSKFREGDTEQLVGTPLTEIPWLTASMREELTYIKVRTLEQLADLNDQACSRGPGLYELKRKAADWLKKANEAAPFTALHAENDELKARLAAMEATLAGLAESKAAPELKKKAS
jgi:hypothetical protein